MDGVIVRDMRASDVSAIYSIGKDEVHLRAAKSRDTWFSAASLAERAKSKHRGIMLVAEYNSNIVGFCSCYLNGWGYIDTIVVGKRYRRKGIAALLISQMIKTLKRRHINYVQLLVNTDNEKMLKLVNKLKFRKGFVMRLVYKIM